MKRMFFLMLFLTIVGTASVNSQVRIGGNEKPNDAAVLDLNVNDDATPTVNKGGLSLPRVGLASLTAQLNNATPVEGTMVYNVSGSLARGVYVWNNNKWNAVRGSSDWVGSDFTATECDGSILAIGAFDYTANGGTPGDVAKGVTDAMTNVNNPVLPDLLSVADSAFNHNPAYYICVYKKDGNNGAKVHWGNAVNHCADGTYADGNPSAGWYLPNEKELAVIYENLGNGVSFFGLEKYGTIVSYTSRMVSDTYWSSTEGTQNFAWLFNFSNGDYGSGDAKTKLFNVRCVKRLPAR